MRNGYHFISEQIGIKAYLSLLEEVYTTPKPGLVDLYSCGAHTDMNVHTFEKSAIAILPYLIKIAEFGLIYKGTPEGLFGKIRDIGKGAEQAMYSATKGVNTHKGAIFSFGIFAASAARCIREYGIITSQNLSEMQLSMTTRTLMREVEEIAKNKCPQSHGECNIKKYNTYGIRGEAIKGYPSVWTLAMPILIEGRQENRDDNLIKLQAFMSLLGKVEDSNIISRRGVNTLDKVHKISSDFIENGGAYMPNAISKLEEMDKEFIDMNISAGGCADLLALALFIEKLLLIE
jgi:triphosphoribosyl-dephospho-CoA synthase CitG